MSVCAVFPALSLPAATPAVYKMLPHIKVNCQLSSIFMLLAPLIMALFVAQPAAADNENFESDAQCRAFCQQFFPAPTAPVVYSEELDASFQYCYEYVCTAGRRAARCAQLYNSKEERAACIATAEALAADICAPLAQPPPVGVDVQDKYCSPGDCLQRVCRPDKDRRPRP